MEVTGGTRFILPDATREAVCGYRWLYPHFMDDVGNLLMSIHALVVDTGERRIVVDTCIGNDKQRTIPNWSNLQTSFLADLETAGYPPASIDTVLCTHLHVDHVGWNTRLVDGEWVPTFPEARYLVAETEWRYWRDAESNQDVLADSVRPVLDAGLVDFVAESHRLCDEVWLEPTPDMGSSHFKCASLVRYSANAPKSPPRRTVPNAATSPHAHTQESNPQRSCSLNPVLLFVLVISDIRPDSAPGYGGGCYGPPDLTGHRRSFHEGGGPCQATRIRGLLARRLNVTELLGFASRAGGPAEWKPDGRTHGAVVGSLSPAHPRSTAPQRKRTASSAGECRHIGSSPF